MAAINSQTQVPTEITTVEAFVVWSGVLLGDIDTSRINFMREDLSGNEFKTSVKASQYAFVRDASGALYIQLINYIPLNSAAMTNGLKIWANATALPLQASSIPAAYLKA